VDDVIGVDPAELAQNQGRRAEAGEDGLDEVGTDEGGEQQPSGTDTPGQNDAEEGEGAGKETDEGIGFHDLTGLI
jgi:hypothetical protein